MLTKLHEAYIALHLAGTTYPNDIFHSLTATFGPLSTFSGKIKLAFAYGLISLNEFKVLESVRQLRNEAAHDATIFSFEDEGVKKLVTGLVEFDRNEINMFGYARKKFMEIPEHKRIFILVCYGLHLTLGDKVADNIEALIKKSDQLKKT